ncbi:MAG: hypothetical protein OXC79_11850 [Candidatus Poribacteria bacterium]|nr:hypothetical protein [Candidatus Poribacteria bacterium]
MRDKVVFFILGAVLATIAYTIGDNNSDAQSVRTGIKEFDEIQCRKLTVFGEIQGSSIRVMDPINKSGFITIDFHDDKGPILTLSSANKKGGIIILSVSDNQADLSVSTVDRLFDLKNGLSLITTEKGSGIVIEGKENGMPRQQ